jgi:protein-L-isoaspartate(D-aspartate) O-methyltransferase
VTEVDWRPLARRLADTLEAGGALRDPGWRRAFESVPRHAFVPRFHTLNQQGELDRLVVLDQHPSEDVLRMIYADDVLVTQCAEASADGTEAAIPTSSASMPSVMAVMLDRLNVSGDTSVLEIGTGTGYNAALLAHRLGPDRVTTVEVDGELAERAWRNLATVGIAPRAVTGDGVTGYPQQAPYDRIIATCSVERIPDAWLEQLAPGGRIVAPLTFGSALAVLDSDGQGGVTGRLDAELVSFMPMRGGQLNVPAIYPLEGTADRRHTELDPHLLDPFAEEHDLRLWISLHLRDATVAISCAEDGAEEGILLTAPGGQAEVLFRPSVAGSWPVTQWGPRRLWDTVEDAWRTWQHHGQPHRTRIGFTAQRDGRQWLWLDRPDRPLPEL